jgi:hypothetical protein
MMEKKDEEGKEKVPHKRMTTKLPQHFWLSECWRRWWWSLLTIV